MFDSPIEHYPELSEKLGVDIKIKRDDLLPFPLAGNKTRKLLAELAGCSEAIDVFITNGSVDSNHCRTLAFLAATRRRKVHLVMHGRIDNRQAALSERMYTALGATHEIVEPDQIAVRIAAADRRFRFAGLRTHVVPGGCHTVAGVQSYSNAARDLIDNAPATEVIVVASGTGATQAGIIDGTRDRGGRLPPRVIGISVARDFARGSAAVAEAVSWVRPHQRIAVEFYDDYTDGGYGRASTATRSIVDAAWRQGLPLDTTYTGKAFRGMIDLIKSTRIPPGSRVVFWHTGGLWNQFGSWLES